MAPIYAVLIRYPGHDKYKIVSLGRGNRRKHYLRYKECQRKGIQARFVTMASGDSKRGSAYESGSSPIEYNPQQEDSDT